MNLSLKQQENGAPSQKIITLKSIYNKEQKATIQPVKDGLGWYHGLKRLSDEDKRGMTYFVEPSTKFTVKHGVSFNLNNPVDAMNWNWLSHSPLIAENLDAAQKSHVACFYVHQEEVEEQKVLSLELLLHKARTFVFNDTPADLINRVRLLGTDMSAQSHFSVQNYLLSLCKTDKGARRVIDVYENPHLGIKLRYFQAKDTGVIEHDYKHGIIRFGNTVLGMSDEAATAYLVNKDNKAVLEAIEAELLNTNLAPAGSYSPEPSAGDEAPVLEFTKVGKK
jgi:hypothetical protein